MAGYAEVEPALKDWKTFISGEGVGLHGMNPALPKPLTLQIDPPDHDKGRRVLGRTLRASQESCAKRFSRRRRGRSPS
ncbi:cytochrome P450 [Bradyrhizobium japonicum]